MLILFVSTILLTYFCLNKTLLFGLSGDDWFTLYRYILDFPTLASHVNLASYINDHSNYNFADLIMGIIYRQFSFSPFPYYLISMILRVIVAISFYWAVYMATKDKLAGYLSTLLFSIMFTGIETTNWVFNMNTYISISFFNLFIFLYIRNDNLSFVLKNLILGIILGLSFIITPNRMHGLLFAIPLITLFKIDKTDNYNFKKYLLRIFLLFLPILGFRFLIRTASDTEYTETLLRSLTQIDFLRSVLVGLGNSAIPESVYNLFGISQDGKAIIVFFIFLLLMIFLYNNQKKMPALSKFALLSAGLSLSFIVIPILLFNPGMLLPSDHRYLIIPGAYIMAFYASIFSIIQKSNKQFLKTFAFLFLVTIFLINILSLRNYFNYLANKGRLAIDSQEQFNYLIARISPSKNPSPIVLLFIPDDPLYLYNSITFGIQYHLMLIDPRFGYDIQRAPFAVDNLESLIEVLSSKDSKELKRYGYKPVKIPLENVYAFRLQNKNLTNITSEVKGYLKEKIPNLKELK